MISFLVLGSLFAVADSSDEERSYQVYTPKIIKTSIYDAVSGKLKYNHGPSIAFYRDHFYAVWNAHTKAAEGQAGQLVYVSTSTNAVDWSAPDAFAKDEATPNSVQWQPTLYNFNDKELWCIWTQAEYGAGGSCGPILLSVLKDPKDGWKTRTVCESIEIDGQQYAFFAMNNPTKLASGRIVAPFIAASQKPGGAELWHAKKYAVFFYTDNGGRTWDWSRKGIVGDPENLDSQQSLLWEPMLVTQTDGNLRMFARLGTSGRDDPKIITAVGTPDAENFSPAEYSPIQTVCSRFWLGESGDRRLMIHHDTCPAIFLNDRVNLALFSSRTGRDDFVAGVPIVDDEPVAAYPQALIHDGKIYMIYSQGKAQGSLYRSIRLAIIDPAPSDDTYYVFPRSKNRVFATVEGKQASLNYLRFEKGDVVQSTWQEPLLSKPFTLTCMVRPTRGGQFSLLEAVSSVGEKFVISLDASRRINIAVAGKKVSSKVSLSYSEWSYMAVLVDPVKKQARVYHNDRFKDTLDLSRLSLNTEATYRVAISTPTDAVVDKLENDIYTDLHQWELYSGTQLNNSQLNFLKLNFYNHPHDQVVYASTNLKIPIPDRTLDPAPIQKLISFIAGNKSPVFVQAGSVYPQAPCPAAVEMVSEGLLRFRGNSSAGVDVDGYEPQRDMLTLEFRVKPEDAPTGEIHFLSVGSPSPIILGMTAQYPSQLAVRVSGTWTPVGNIQVGFWNTVKVSFSKERVLVDVNGSSGSVDIKGYSQRVYFGDGYPDTYISPVESFLIDVSSLKSFVKSN